MSYLRQAFTSLSRVSDTPERTAFAFAIGVFYGFGPLLGLHTILAVATAFVFRLNKVAILLGTWSNLPWIVVPFYAFATWVGITLLGLPEGVSLPRIGLGELIRMEFWLSLLAQWKLLIPAVFGSFFLSTVMAGLAYPTALYVIRRYRNEDS